MYGSGTPLLHTRRNAYEEAPRKSRDIICIAIFALVWFGMVIVATVASKTGNPKRLIYPTDHSGNLCPKDQPNLFFPHPDEDVINSNEKDKYQVAFFGICVHKCPKKGDIIHDYIAPITTESIFHRCLPSNDSNSPVEYEYIFDETTQFLNFIGRYVGDIKETFFPIFVCGGIMAFVLALVWVLLLIFMPKIIVWLSIFLAQLLCFIFTIFCAFHAGYLKNNTISKYVNKFEIHADGEDITYFKIASCVLIIIDLCMFFSIIFFFSRINLSVGILKEAAKAMRHIPSLFFFPFIPAIALTILFFYFVVTSAYIGSSDSITLRDISNSTGQKIATEKPNNLMWWLFGYNLFGVLWTHQLIEAISICTISGAICRYYWNDNKGNLDWPLGGSLYYSFRYHFGSLAFGSCVLSFVQFVRLFFEFIDRCTRGSDSKFIKMIASCFKMCLWCQHKVLKFLNKTGYIMIAMKGTSFCTSITSSFKLMITNTARIATVSVLTSYILLLGKIMIVTSCMSFVYYYVYEYPHDYEISSIFPTLLLTGLLAFTMSYFCLSTFDVSVDTILLSVCEDEKINRSTGSYYGSSSLLNYLDETASQAFSYSKNDMEKKNISSAYAGI